MQILVAEDDSASSKLLVWILEEEGHTVLAFPDGKAAFEHFKQEPCSVVISDWMMPEMDGLELCQHIRNLELQAYTHFILLTAKTGQESYREAMDAGVDDFLNKPVDHEELIIRLRVAERILQQRRSAEAQISALARFPEDNPNPVITVNANSLIKYTNDACAPLLEKWNLARGMQIPGELTPLLTNGSAATLTETEITCGDQIYSFAVTSIHESETAYIYGHNITARKKAERELLELKNKAIEAALHDQLTGLPNRVLFNDRLTQGASRCRRRDTRMGLIMIDLDNFKTINDSQGHQAGDMVLNLAGECITEALRDSDTVCRWGGDELMVLVPDLPDRSYMPMICDKIRKSIRHRVETSHLGLPVTLSMGYTVFPDNASENDLLIQQADYALYEAKAAGRNCYREFQGYAKGQESKGVAQLYIRLTEAIENNEIDAHFQPLISAETRRIVGVETLARWTDTGERIAPDMFIPMAEERGLITGLGEQVAKHGLNVLHSCQEKNVPITVSLNLSRLQLLDPNFRPWLQQRCEQLKLDPKFIILEVTERQSLLSHDLCRQRLIELSEAGFRLSLDDFGTGYASLDLVAEMPFNELKIPRPLIMKVETKRGRRIVQAIAEMAKTLSLEIVAEGIENEETVKVLQDIGVNKLQGYYFSKPLPAAELTEWLEKNPPAPQVLDLPKAA